MEVFAILLSAAVALSAEAVKADTGKGSMWCTLSAATSGPF